MPIQFPATLWSSANTTSNGTSNTVTTRALEQWVIAANGTVSSGNLTSVTTVNGNCTLTGSNVQVGTDSAGFTFMQLNGSSSSMTANISMKDRGIEIANGVEWHAVVGFANTNTGYFAKLEEAAGEGRAHIRVYRYAANGFTVYPEPGGSNATSTTYTGGGDKFILSAWRNVTTGDLGIAVNGSSVLATTATGFPLARNVFRFWDWLGASVNLKVYESLGYVDNLTTTERNNTINALKLKYNDPNYANVSLLLHMDGANGSTTFTDSSSNALTVTANGNAQISTAQSKFGGASGYFDGSINTYLRIASNPVFDFGTGDFTVETWFNTSNLTSYHIIVSRWNNGGTNAFGIYTNGSNINFDLGSTTGSNLGSITANSWNHVALTRSGTSVKGFVNGNLTFTGTNSSSLTATSAVLVGSNDNGTHYYFNGYIDDLRITKGMARYTANLTPPTAPFPNS